MTSRSFVALLLLGSLGASRAGGQGLGGTLTQDTLLGSEGSPYMISADLIIPSGITLTLQPGAVLKLSPKISLVVQGNLTASGGATAAEMVSLVSSEEGTFWGRIDCQGGKVDLSRTFVVAGGLVVRSGEVAVRDSVIAGCEVGLTLMGGRAEVKGCRVSKNKAGFDLASASGVISIQGSEISQNGYGIAARAFQSAEIHGNRIHQNQMGLANLSANSLDASGNWWGSQDGLEIGKAVLDKEDDARYGAVEVRPLFGETAVAVAPSAVPTAAPQPTPSAVVEVQVQATPVAAPPPLLAADASLGPPEPEVPEEELWSYGDPYLDMKGLPWEGQKNKAKKTAVTLGSVAAVAVAVLLLL